MINIGTPGAPLPLQVIHPEGIVTEVGNFQAADGARISLAGNELIFTAHMDGDELKMGVAIEYLLDSIAKYTRGHES